MMFNKLKKSESGFTLVEVIAGTAILSIALVGAAAAFITLSRLHSSSLTVQQIQQESRNIVEAITRDVRSGSTVERIGNRLVITNSVTLDRIEYFPSSDGRTIYRLFCERSGGGYSCDPNASAMNTETLEVKEFQFAIDRNGVSGAPYVALHFVFVYNEALENIDPFFQEYELNSLVTVRTING